MVVITVEVLFPSFRQKKLKSDKKVYENRFLEGCD